MKGVYMKDNGFVGFNYKRNEVTAAKMREFREQLMELGIDSTGFDEDTDKQYEDDIKAAKKFLYRGEKVPDEIRKRLLERKNSLKVNKPRLLYRNIRMGEYKHGRYNIYR